MSRQDFAVRMRFGQLSWVLPALALAALAPAVSAQGTRTSSDVEREFQAAMAARNRGDAEQAEILLRALDKAHPGIFAVDESLGLLLVSRDDVAPALPFLEAAVREQPSSDAAHANFGAALYALHRSAPALTQFEEAARIQPANVSTQQSLGRLYMEIRQPAKAATALLTAVKLKPGDAELQLDCITALLAANRTNEAQNMLASLAGADESARAQSLLGETAEKEGQYKDAVEHFMRAAQLDPDEENAWQLGAELLRHWTFDDAVRKFQIAAAKYPGSTRMKFGLGAAYYGGGRYAEAAPLFADLLEADDSNASYAAALGMACTAPTEKPEPRCDVLVRYAETHPHDATAATCAATRLLQDSADNQIRRARKLLNNALAANPNLPDANYQMGLLLQDGGDWAGSIVNLRRAVEAKPDFSQAHYHLALAYWRTGHKRQGQAEMDLQRKYSRQEQEDEDQRLRQITTFVINLRN
ncbi:MAG TPA: tetratricopeptide repeat protein [Acidobacteriaceae bacterium]|jgi:tetratricopeptide (TPR) repeat protein|nr:tetratricopeptide repeat protein [Acidobacteriaceae bacterium]